ncbi:PREDICTED: olfactory receptor 1-like [Cyprinodon variegatus]|uniref:olfactory receptor 1-like n=1 Tax=Cyprinodon variegatus TaxID=28743 RepID=UPI0007429E6B|nr:PREDICTED: olfactory receptor 1-like [Cyprinodon variegatus]
MDLFNPASVKNITFIRPPYFIIRGFTDLPEIRFYYYFLFVAYIFLVQGNTAVMALIYLDRNLRTPKYVAVFNLAFVDLLGGTALVPKVLDIFLFNHYYIPYNDCLTFFFFCYICLSMQALNLVALCYDRLMAIMFPLHYHVNVTHKIMFSLIAFFWSVALLAVCIAIGFLTTLSFCNSVVINSFFCDHGQMYRLACNDNFPSFVIANLLPVLFLWLPLLIIISSYICIGYALARVTSAQERLKALKTCVGHLSLVATFFFPIIITFIMGPSIHPNARIINLSLTSAIPPVLNPLIYVMHTQEMKLSIKSLIKRRNKSKIMN